MSTVYLKRSIAFYSTLENITKVGMRTNGLTLINLWRFYMLDYTCINAYHYLIAKDLYDHLVLDPFTISNITFPTPKDIIWCKEKILYNKINIMKNNVIRLNEQIAIYETKLDNCYAKVKKSNNNMLYIKDYYIILEYINTCKYKLNALYEEIYFINKN